MRVLSGMQSSGSPHLGNYLGAMKHHLEMQKQHECFYFIANYHALTTVRDKKKLEESTHELAIDYLSLGIDPEKTIFFRQSDVPEHTELCWIFNCITGMGLLERAHAWKDAKSGKRKETTAGLFDYPVLMAADILIYKPDLVPVGRDQKQHVEITRDIAVTFNDTFGETFPLPEALIDEKTAVVPGTDGAKMSKSYGNVIEIFADEKMLEKQVLSIKTDSTPLEKPKNPEACTVFHLFSLVASPQEVKNLREKYLAGNFGYGEAKKMLFQKLLELFQPYRQKRIELQNNLDYVEKVLKTGAKKAREVARKTIDEVRAKVGIA